VLVGAGVVAVSTLAAVAVFASLRAWAPRAVGAPAEPPRVQVVIVESDPVGARIEWQSKVLGVTPAAVELPVGINTLHIIKEDFAPEDLVIAVNAGGTKTHHARITLKAVRDPTPVAVAVAVTPPDPPRLVPKRSRGPKGRWAPAAPRAPATATPVLDNTPSSGTPSAAPAVGRADEHHRVRLFNDEHGN
jgi:hypothetical protein